MEHERAVKAMWHENVVEAIIQDHVLEVNDMQMKLKYGASVFSESIYKSQHK